MGGRGMASHARACGEAAEGGVDVIAVEGDDDALPTPSARKRKGRPPKGTPSPPPPKAPRTASPAEWAEPAAGRGQRGAVHEWVQQQQLLQRAGAWEARAMSAEDANCDLEDRPSRANEDRRAAESRLVDLTKERDRLDTRVKTLERDLGTARKAAGVPARPPAQTGGGGLRVPRAPRVRGRWVGGGRQWRRCPVPSGRRAGLACPGRGMRRPDVSRVHRPPVGHAGQWPAS